ncbi:DUF1643 domain-containing protein [Marinovum sp. 2_MG-2023]|uniref:DUF1643 domain-containing protein n=1 Tax=unclassified Marinovum TaxID=2647166 RepID=UPI0026E4186F|nr:MULTISPECIES: DUF1643 domain-containing protein [unclassified Marinovum]MDO6730325.1 DUF1643 domain-containing protein [Marinovum sp. 2_MG-2023]MDO6779063.1 DUF1643 domain-containing protein [Marinovum sp. 1_MG-2023]
MVVRKTHEAEDCRSEAVYSDCGLYRYRLRRSWDVTAGQVAFVMLNPSTANEKVNDPTIARCERRARLLGYGGLDVVNLFAFRATDPKDLRAAPEPIGPENDQFLADAFAAADIVLAAWGVHGRLHDRDSAVLPLLNVASGKLFTLGLTRHGLPRHPLYVSYGQKPEPWQAGF